MSMDQGVLRQTSLKVDKNRKLSIDKKEKSFAVRKKELTESDKVKIQGRKSRKSSILPSIKPIK